MPVINRKRRAPAEVEPSPAPTRRKRSPSISDASSVDESVDGEDTQEGSSQDQMVKKLLRLALASEYSRTPIRRADISAKVMAPNTGRQFKHVFMETQNQLRSVFGMELTELPVKEKVTISQKRAAQRSGTQASSTSNAYILTSTLPARYRKPSVLRPSQIPSTGAEASYVGLTTFILALIYLSPSQTISESRLEKHLKRMNADNYVLAGEKTEKVLKRMERESYIVKVRERDMGGEESVEYVIGSRGKVEVGERGVAGLVKAVYGKKDAEADELERRLVRSLGDVVLEKKKTRVDGVNGDIEEEENEADEARAGAQESEEEDEQQQQQRRPPVGGRKGSKKQTAKQTRRSSGRNKKRANHEEEEEEDDSDEGAEDDDEEESDE
ncbi:MAGE family-domain-containing protein [Usnea florida]